MAITRDLLYKVIKERWERLHPHREHAVFWGDVKSPRYSTVNRDYYFIVLDDNLDERMSPEVRYSYDNGDGGELEEYFDKYGRLQPPKIQSLASSSALTFNMFLNGNVTITGELRDHAVHSYPAAADGEKGPESGIGNTYEVEYEKKLRVFNTGDTAANLDAYLYDTDARAIFVETKYLEWITDEPKTLAPCYGDPSRYPAELCEALKTLRARINAKGFRHLDAKQLCTHICGIYNERFYRGGLSNAPRRITLALCYWAPDPQFFEGTCVDPAEYQAVRDEFAAECRLFTDCLTDCRPSVFDLFREKGAGFEFAAIPADRLMKITKITPGVPLAELAEDPAGALDKMSGEPRAASEFMKRYLDDTP
ncbi:MAG: hypothetical protein J5758_02295 [Abditibacteriota bacterium]|nr:hypothetical protein [Abditibacteriota bacterium]